MLCKVKFTLVLMNIHYINPHSDLVKGPHTD